MNDYAGLLSGAERERLESILAAGERATGAQVVIAVFRSLEGESLEDATIRLAERWRIGRKGLDDGVIVVVFVRERRVRLEVGYGLEGTIPDVVASRIIRDSVAPRFREARYAEGLEAAVAAILARVEGRESPDAAARASRHAGPGLPSWAVLGFFVLLALTVLILLRDAIEARRFVRRNTYTAGGRGWSTPVVLPGPTWGGGGWSAGGGGFSGGGGGFGGGGASGEW